ncbi:MAG TPA: sigma-54 dependent transcriptional regulator [Gemmatimonadales bacterium]|nr:sigma-54 dependent transcriptional regulator [Gemmatimonadales bacterium]
MPTILIVDDIPALADQYAYDLRRMGGGTYDVLTAPDGRKALELVLGGDIDCMILDLEMPGMDGFEVLRTIEHKGIETPVIVYTGTGSYDRCIEAVRLGAYGFIDKSEPMERVVREVESTLERRRLRAEVKDLRRQLGDSSLVGRSAALKSLQKLIARLAPIPSTVLVLGESGSGKELVARDLHRLGSAPNGPFVAINCAALPEQLIESELFGHEKGAFTGAVASRKGAFEAAEQGTLFLDEIGELPLAMQAKLLRVLEDRKVTRLGGNRPVAVSARVVAATNRDLEAEVKAGQFRQDLLFRINAHQIRVPALRERREDIVPIAEKFLVEICGRFGMRPKKMAGEVTAMLTAYDWRKNNVRELRNAVERMVIASDGEIIRADDMPAEIADGSAGAGKEGLHTLAELKARAEKQIVLEALERNEWHITRTAAELGLSDHASLLKIMRRLEIRREAGA